jgi:hypothetical protein
MLTDQTISDNPYVQLRFFLTKSKMIGKKTEHTLQHALSLKTLFLLKIAK